MQGRATILNDITYDKNKTSNKYDTFGAVRIAAPRLLHSAERGFLLGARVEAKADLIIHFYSGSFSLSSKAHTVLCSRVH